MKSSIYIVAAIIVMAAIWLVLRFDNDYGPVFTKLSIGAIILLLIIVQLISIREKQQQKEPIARHIGIVIGLIALFIFRLFV